MDLSGYIVQVTRPTAEHRSAKGAVRAAKRLGVNSMDVYSLDADVSTTARRFRGCCFMSRS